MISMEVPKSKNPHKIKSGRQSVLSRLENVGVRCNDLIAKDLDKKAVNYMACNADVFEGSDTASASGHYTADSCVHAEMNALALYIRTETDFRTVDKIEISAPPCKSCGFVLELLGVIGKVKTTKQITKHATGSWKWPDKLKDPRTFDDAKWQIIKNYFSGSGLSDYEILEHTVNVVQSQSAN